MTIKGDPIDTTGPATAISIGRAVNNLVPVYGTFLATKDMVRDWNSMSNQQKGASVFFNAVSAFGDVVLIGGVLRVALQATRYGNVLRVSQSYTSTDDLVTAATDLKRPPRSVVVEADAALVLAISTSGTD